MLNALRPLASGGHPQAAAGPANLPGTPAAEPGPDDYCCTLQELQSIHVASTAADFCRSLQGWEVCGSDKTDKVAAAWNKRVANARLVGGSITTSSADRPVIVARLGDIPVGLMRVTETMDQRYLYILEAATHAGCEGVFRQLVTDAMNRSQRQGMDGRLRLCAMFRSAEAAYEAMGFEGSVEAPMIMSLDPAEREDLWMRDALGLWKRRTGAR